MDQNPPQNLSHLAIDAALSSQWEDALKLNKKIIKKDPKNIDALARLARVFMELGRFNLAKKYYTEVTKIDAYNPIALKNLKIIKSFKPNGYGRTMGINHLDCVKLSPSLFLQEPGKTKIVNLLKVAEPQKLSQAYCGMKLEIMIKNRRITLVSANGDYLGVLPDDINHHLLRLIKGGNKYDLYIKAIKVNGLSILIKEIHRSKRFKNQPSFLENSDASRISDIFTPLNNQHADQPEENTEETN